MPTKTRQSVRSDKVGESQHAVTYWCSYASSRKWTKTPTPALQKQNDLVLVGSLGISPKLASPSDERGTANTGALQTSSVRVVGSIVSSFELPRSDEATSGSPHDRSKYRKDNVTLGTYLYLRCVVQPDKAAGHAPSPTKLRETASPYAVTLCERHTRTLYQVLQYGHDMFPVNSAGSGK